MLQDSSSIISSVNTKVEFKITLSLNFMQSVFTTKGSKPFIHKCIAACGGMNGGDKPSRSDLVKAIIHTGNSRK